MKVDPEQKRAEDKAARREKKRTPRMRMSGKGLKRFAKPGKKKD